MKVSVILVNYNGLVYNDTCIASVLENGWEQELHIYVVDNGSADGSMERLDETWEGCPNLTLLYMGENLGFAAANNAGIRRALEDGTDFILLLNNDTCLEKGMIGELVRAVGTYPDCIAVPKIFYFDRRDTIWSAGGGFSRVVKKPFALGENRKDGPAYDAEKKCANANGCCLLFSGKTLEKVGFLDESFFLYYEDTEYFMRAGEKGVQVVYVPTAKLYHKVNGSTKGNDNPACVYYITRNWLMCHKKHLGRGNYLVFWLYFMLNRGAWTAIWLLRGQTGQARAVLLGIRDFYRGRTGRYLA